MQIDKIIQPVRVGPSGTSTRTGTRPPPLHSTPPVPTTCPYSLFNVHNRLLRVYPTPMYGYFQHLCNDWGHSTSGLAGASVCGAAGHFSENLCTWRLVR